MGVNQLGKMTTEEVGALLSGGKVVIVLLPVGSVEPHGPHLPLETDCTISEAAALAAGGLLEAEGLAWVLAPTVAYGVTDCAAGFPGAISVSADALTNYLNAVIHGFLATGFAHICLINNHLEPGHDQAVRRAVDSALRGKASVACPLTRRWGRTLSDEYKRGECHAGQYETSIMMAADSTAVKEKIRRSLPAVPISLAEKLQAGVTTFREMGMEKGYAGAPASASSEEGAQLIGKLAHMVAAEIIESLALGENQ